MIQTLYHYSYLQVLDFLTTVAFLINGVQEGNPVVNWAIQVFPSPMAGLVAVKIVALGLGIYCWLTAKTQVLGRINIAFAVLVAWNLITLIVKTAH
ncbi:MAG: hypothetical protein FJW30_27070 [Acidobacteria bacterium]|nr:hypothetical protein [Acidobacteriota bacterium]